MAEETFLTDDFLRQLINVGEVDILVGLPTHNNAKTIGSIVSTIQSGLLRGFPRERAVIINVDGGSRDGTPELVTGISPLTMRVPRPICMRSALCTSSARNMRTLPTAELHYEPFLPRRNCSGPKHAS